MQASGNNTEKVKSKTMFVDLYATRWNNNSGVIELKVDWENDNIDKRRDLVNITWNFVLFSVPGMLTTT